MSDEAPGAGSSAMMKKAFPHVDIDGHDLPPSPAPSSPHAGKRYAIATELVYTESNDQYNASSVPIYQVRFVPIQRGIVFTYELKREKREMLREMPM